MTQFGISIGNLPVLIETSDTGIADFIRQNFRGFIAPDISAQHACDGLWRITARLSQKKRMSKTSPPYAVNFRRRSDSICLSRDDFRAAVNLQGQTCEIDLKSPDLIDVFLRVFYSAVGIYNHSILLHAAGLKYKGRAHLFVAPPMGGKTTIVKNAQVNEVFSDELVLLSKTNGYWKAYSTPFGGSFPAYSSFNSRLAGIWFLNKSKGWSVLQITKACACKWLLKNVLFFSKERGKHLQLLELVSDLVEKVPAGELDFAKEGTVTDYLS